MTTKKWLLLVALCFYFIVGADAKVKIRFEYENQNFGHSCKWKNSSHVCQRLHSENTINQIPANQPIEFILDLIGDGDYYLKFDGVRIFDETKATTFAVGDKVQGKYEGVWYDAKIEANNGDGTYKIRWTANNNVKRAHPEEQLRLRVSSRKIFTVKPSSSKLLDGKTHKLEVYKSGWINHLLKDTFTLQVDDDVVIDDKWSPCRETLEKRGLEMFKDAFEQEKNQHLRRLFQNPNAWCHIRDDDIEALQGNHTEIKDDDVNRFLWFANTEKHGFKDGDKVFLRHDARFGNDALRPGIPGIVTFDNRTPMKDFVYVKFDRLDYVTGVPHYKLTHHRPTPERIASYENYLQTLNLPSNGRRRLAAFMKEIEASY